MLSHLYVHVASYQYDAICTYIPHLLFHVKGSLIWITVGSMLNPVFMWLKWANCKCLVILWSYKGILVGFLMEIISHICTESSKNQSTNWLTDHHPYGRAAPHSMDCSHSFTCDQFMTHNGLFKLYSVLVLWFFWRLKKIKYSDYDILCVMLRTEIIFHFTYWTTRSHWV